MHSQYIKQYAYLSCLLILFYTSCYQEFSPKNSGKISSELFEIASIDTTNHSVKPIVLHLREFSLRNTSIKHKIKFICQATILDNKQVIATRTESHMLTPGQHVKLKIDSNWNVKLINYKIAEATVIND